MLPVLPEYEDIVQASLEAARELYTSAFEGFDLEDRIFIQVDGEQPCAQSRSPGSDIVPAANRSTRALTSLSRNDATIQTPNGTM